MTKKSSKFTKKITHVDDMMIHNFVKYLVQTRLNLWDIKITNFKPESCPDDLLEIYYFYISKTKSNLDKIFYNIVYHHIIYMCDFFREFRWFFFMIYTSFYESLVSTRYVPFLFTLNQVFGTEIDIFNSTKWETREFSLNMKQQWQHSPRWSKEQ